MTLIKKVLDWLTLWPVVDINIGSSEKAKRVVDSLVENHLRPLVREVVERVDRILRS